MNKFDDIIKTKLEQHEFAYDPSRWDSLSAAMSDSGVSATTATSFKTSLIGGIAATALMSAVMIGAPSLSTDERTTEKQHSLSESSKIKETSSPVEKSDEHAPAANFEVQKEHEIVLVELKKQDKGNNKIGQASDGNKSNELDIKSSPSNIITETLDNDTPAESPDGNPGLAIDFIAKGVQCEGKVVSFHAIAETEGAIQWIIDDVYVLEGEKTDFSFDSPGDHTVRMIFRRSNNRTSDIVKQVTIYERPKIDILLTDEITDDCFNRKVNFKASPNNHRHSWTLNGELSSSESEFSSLLNQGWYDIALSAISERGCTNKVTTSYNVEGGTTIFLPSAFSPTKQDGLNDTYLPANLDKMASFSLKVTRSSTLKVAYETSELRPWDGSIMNTSEMARTGELFMVEVVATDHCGNTQSFAQQLTVR